MNIKKRLVSVLIGAAMVMLLTGRALTLTAYADEELREASQCTFVIPSEFKPSGTKGLFIHKSYPMESCSVMYTVYDNGGGIRLTNREREAVEQNPSGIVDSSGELTKKHFQDLFSATYNREYGVDVGYKVSSFDNIAIDGYPGYKVTADYKAGDEERIFQTVYMIRSHYKTFVITYQRADDDDADALFDASAKTLHVF